MPAIPGSKVVVGLYDESPYKTAAASGLRLPFSQFNLTSQQQRRQSEVLAGYYGDARGVLGNKGVSGSINTECGPESIGWFLKHLIGKPVSAVAGSANKHTFTVGTGVNDIPAGFTAEEDFGTALASATHRVMKYIGCRLGSGALNFGTEGFIGVNFDVLGADMVPAAAPIDASLDDLGHTSFSVADTSIVLSSGATIPVCFRALTLNFSNDLDPDFFCLTGGGIRDDLPRSKFGAGAQGTALFDSDDLLKQTLADTDASLVTGLTRGTGDGTAGNEKVLFTIPALTFSPASVPVQGPRGLTLQVNATAHRTTGEIGVKAELWNPQASI